MTPKENQIFSINPYNQETLDRFEMHTEMAVDQRIEQADFCWREWKETSLPERAEVLLAIANQLEKDKEKLANLATLEMGKRIAEARAEIEKCALVCRFFAKNLEEFLAPQFIQTEASKSYIRKDSLGVILAIMPWNFPFWQVFRVFAPNLAGGNVLVLKHALNTPQCALAISSLIEEASGIKNLLTNIFVSDVKTADVIADRRIKGITLTGGENAGRSVASAAGLHLKKTVLELGGSDPFIVLKDAPIAQVVKQAVQARLICNGQSCISAKRFLIEAPVFEAFTNLMKEEMDRIQMGNPLLETTQLGPLAKLDLAEKLHQQVKMSIQLGAQQLTSAAYLPNEYFFPPMVLTHVRPGTPAFEEELFGPVAAVSSFEKEDEMLRLANISKYGLGASVWTKDIEKAEFLASKLECGNVYVNEMVRSDPRLPFGGIKNSGFGKELGSFGFYEFLNIKTVLVK